MCGIAGYFGRARVDGSAIRSCLALMRRRGPDHAAARCWRTPADQNAILLSTRLSIIDLDERANQPFNAGSKWMVYNGEVYNYQELRVELAAEGVRFTTTSDTEVLLRAIDRWGWAALDRCEGMWAFAVYDEAAGALTIARDRFGEKPLYLYRDRDGLYFGSEVKCLAALAGRSLRPNSRQLRRYLVNGYKSLYKTRETFFDDVEELPAATLQHYAADGTWTSERYWVPDAQPDEAMSYADAVAGTRERLLQAVGLRLRADVPLAFCMSGGVDSNALIGAAKRVFGYDVHGFTVENTDGRYEERDMVAHAVEAFDIRHTWVPIRPVSFLDRLCELVDYHDAPVHTISHYLHWTLASEIHAAGYRVSTSGNGADELFTGYYDHHNAYLCEVRADERLFARSLADWEAQVRPWVRNPHLQDPLLFVRNPAFRDHIFLNADRFASYLTAEWSEPFAETQMAPGLLRNRMMNELFHEVVPVLLHEDDLNSMYFSIENRSPFLDRDLFEFSARIPVRHLVKDGLRKSVLRDAIEGLVPDRIRKNGRKVGFNAPVASLLDVRDPATRQALLADGPVFDLVRREKIEGLLNQPELANSESKFLFYFVNTKLFLEAHA